MPVFAVSGTRAPAATTSLLSLTGSATLRSRIQGIRIGTTGVPSSEASVEVYLRQSTAAGTGTSVTPRPKNSVSVAGSTALSNLSVEPTYAAGQPMLVIPFNPRLFGQWREYDVDSSLHFIAASANGIGFQAQVAGGALTSIDCDCDMYE